MAKVESDNLNFDELTPAAEPVVLTEEPAADDAGAPIEAKPDEKKNEKDEDDTAEDSGIEEPENKLPDYLALGGVIFVPLILLVLAWFQYLFFSTAIYFIGLVFIPYGVWLGRKKNTVYTVFLGCVAAALLTAAYFLWTEIGRYNFDLGAQEAKQRVSVVAAPTGRYV